MKDALLGISSALRKRKNIQANIQVDIQEVMRMIKAPRKMDQNPLGLIIVIPKLLIKFILAVRVCREQRRDQMQTDRQGKLSTPYKSAS